MMDMQKPYSDHLRFLMTVTPVSGIPSFGLCVRNADGTYLASAENLSTNRAATDRLITLCELWQPDPCHLRDLAEDFLT